MRGGDGLGRKNVNRIDDVDAVFSSLRVDPLLEVNRKDSIEREHRNDSSPCIHFFPEPVFSDGWDTAELLGVGLKIETSVLRLIKRGLLASEWVMLNSKAVLEALFTG